MALPFLRGFASQKFTPTEALAALKPLDLTFNRQRMLDVYAVLQDRLDPERTGRLVGQNVPIPQDLHTTSPSTLSSNYQYVVEAFDEFGNVLGAVTVSSSVPLSVSEVRSRGGLLIASNEELYLEDENVVINSVSVVEANISPTVARI